ncbi:MAG: glycosyltransferase family 2 protein [Phycisphaerae bacterium]|nr:glycosyltransferase family 2 protein [Planctomycetota bacterium]MBL7106531.1 glycosyltransferase family 2 protein [Phycisphaerae bacterium]
MFYEQTVKVIIPALNEALSIGKVIAAIPQWADEIIVVDNGSTDKTFEVAKEHGAKVIKEPRRGYGQACLTGMVALEHCDIVVFLDADYSDYPEQMNLLVEPIVDKQAEMVIGSRVKSAKAAQILTPVQRFGNALSCWLIRLLWGGKFSDLGPFRAIRWASLQKLQMKDRNYGWTIEMQIKAVRLDMSIKEVPVSYRKRIGKSKISGTVKGSAMAGIKILSTILKYAICPITAK